MKNQCIYPKDLRMTKNFCTKISMVCPHTEDHKARKCEWYRDAEKEARSISKFTWDNSSCDEEIMEKGTIIAKTQGGTTHDNQEMIQTVSWLS